jgi:hypothetical protein
MESDMDYANVIVKTVFKLVVYWVVGIGLLWLVFVVGALGIGSAVTSIHRANAPPGTKIEYVDCDQIAPMMRDQRCKPK